MREDLNDITFAQMPKGMQHLSDSPNRHGRSLTFFILLIIVSVLFSGFYWFSKTHPSQIIDPETPTKSVSLVEIRNIEQELAATVVPDYSALF